MASSCWLSWGAHLEAILRACDVADDDFKGPRRAQLHRGFGRHGVEAAVQLTEPLPFAGGDCPVLVGDLFDGAANRVTERNRVFPGGQRDAQLFGAEAGGGGRCVAGVRRACGRCIRIFRVVGERIALLEKLRGHDCVALCAAMSCWRRRRREPRARNLPMSEISAWVPPALPFAARRCRSPPCGPLRVHRAPAE
jgi:hypothetical protein